MDSKIFLGGTLYAGRTAMIHFVMSDGDHMKVFEALTHAVRAKFPDDPLVIVQSKQPPEILVETLKMMAQQRGMEINIHGFLVALNTLAEVPDLLKMLMQSVPEDILMTSNISVCESDPELWKIIREKLER